MPSDKQPLTKRAVWTGVVGTAAVATVLNFVILPIWFTLVLASGSSDISPDSGIFAACDDAATCVGPDWSFIMLAAITLIGLAAASAKAGQMLGRIARRPKIFLLFWLLAGAL